MSLASRLLMARQKNGWTRRDVASRAGIEENTLYMYESGRREPPVISMIGLAALYGTTLSWLRDEEQGLTEVDLDSLRIIGSISAGGLIDGWETDLGVIQVPENIRRQAPRAFALRVNGNSLASSAFFDGDILVVDPDAPLVDGRIYAVRSEAHNQAIAARHVYVMGRRRLKIVSGDGEVIEVERSRTDILGRVRWSFREH